jgi:hypothetical protein
MSWTAITADDVRERFSEDELELLQTAGTADGQADPLPGVIAQVTDECRGYIAARSGNTLGPAGTLPPQTRSAAISIIVWRLASRLAIGKAGELIRSPSRQQDYQDASSLLKDVSQGKMAVEQPDTPGPENITFSPGKYGGNPPVDFTV